MLKDIDIITDLTELTLLFKKYPLPKTDQQLLLWLGTEGFIIDGSKYIDIQEIDLFKNIFGEDKKIIDISYSYQNVLTL